MLICSMPHKTLHRRCPEQTATALATCTHPNKRAAYKDKITTTRCVFIGAFNPESGVLVKTLG